jgi:hypothetical protein
VRLCVVCHRGRRERRAVDRREMLGVRCAVADDPTIVVSDGSFIRKVEVEALDASPLCTRSLAHPSTSNSTSPCI